MVSSLSITSIYTWHFYLNWVIYRVTNGWYWEHVTTRSDEYNLGHWLDMESQTVIYVHFGLQKPTRIRVKLCHIRVSVQKVAVPNLLTSHRARVMLTFCAENSHPYSQAMKFQRTCTTMILILPRLYGRVLKGTLASILKARWKSFKVNNVHSKMLLETLLLRRHSILVLENSCILRLLACSTQVGCHSIYLETRILCECFSICCKQLN